jgi:transposase-like protein
MTVVSVADACRCLGIDAKTLRRWVAQAQLSLQDHPCDGRKKGVSREHLELLAHLHHRHLDALPEEPPPPIPTQRPSLPAELLALPETIGTLQAQITALQQQVATLTSLLQQHLPQPASPPPPAPQPKRSPRPPSPAPTKTPAKPAHVIPRVEYAKEGHYVVICPKRGVLPFEPDTPEWFAWVAKQDSFRFIGKLGHFTAHHEWRVPNGAWRAHRHIRNHVHILRLAPNQDLTIAVLEQAAEALQAHLTTRLPLL